VWVLALLAPRLAAALRASPHCAAFPQIAFVKDAPPAPLQLEEDDPMRRRGRKVASPLGSPGSSPIGTPLSQPLQPAEVTVSAVAASKGPEELVSGRSKAEVSPAFVPPSPLLLPAYFAPYEATPEDRFHMDAANANVNQSLFKLLGRTLLGSRKKSEQNNEEEEAQSTASDSETSPKLERSDSTVFGDYYAKRDIIASESTGSPPAQLGKLFKVATVGDPEAAAAAADTSGSAATHSLNKSGDTSFGTFQKHVKFSGTTSSSAPRSDAGKALLKKALSEPVPVHTGMHSGDCLFKEEGPLPNPPVQGSQSQADGEPAKEPAPEQGAKLPSRAWRPRSLQLKERTLSERGAVSLAGVREAHVRFVQGFLGRARVLLREKALMKAVLTFVEQAAVQRIQQGEKIGGGDVTWFYFFTDRFFHVERIWLV